VLQHPHEARRKNRSLPLIEMCFAASTDQNDEDDWSIKTLIGRRLGDKTPEKLMKLIQSSEDVILVFPDDDKKFLRDGVNCETRAMSLHEGLEELKIRRLVGRQQKYPENKNNLDSSDIFHNERVIPATLIFIDATWKYAKEMVATNTRMELWPKDLIRVSLFPFDNNCNEISFVQESRIRSSVPIGFRPNRFDIRTPPSVKHLSTAECIAWVTSVVEEDPDLYKILMKPLDAMVKQWNQFLIVKEKVKKERIT